MKKLGLFIATAVMLVLFAFSASAEKWNDYYYNEKTDGTIEISGYVGMDADLKIPATINGKRVTSLGKNSFSANPYIKTLTIPDGVTHIGSDSFWHCDNLTALVLPDSIISIGSNAFSDCFNLNSLIIPDNIKYIENSAFANCEALSFVKIPCSAIYSSNIFFNDTNIKEIVLTKGTGTMSPISFPHSPWEYSKNNIEKVTIEYGVKNISSHAFNGCTNLNTVNIADSVTSIGNYAFKNCLKLTNIIIPNSVSSIGDSAFYNCTELVNLEIPNNITSIGNNAFFNCKNLTKIYINDIYSWCKIKFGNFSANPLIYADLYLNKEKVTNLIIPDNITSIREYAFYGYVGLKSITIPNSVRIIYEESFKGCKNLKVVNFIGSKNQWQETRIFDGNAPILNATIKYICPHTKAANESIVAATLTKNGYTAGIYCKDCENWIEGHKIIPQIDSVTLSKTNYIYDGKNKTPTVTVKDANGKKLVKNTDYKLSVASKRSGIGRYTVKVTFMGNYSGSKNVYFYIKPGKPTSVKSASQTTSSVKLSWSAVPGASGYTVYRYSPSKKAYVNAGTTTGTSLTVKSLYAGTKYTFRVVAYGKTSAGKVYESDSYALLKTATKTATPTLSKVTTTKGKAVLTHTNVSGETGYTVYYSTKKDSGFKKYANFKADTTTCNITGLTSGKTYYFKVRTYITTDSGYVYSAWSTVKSVKVK